MSNAKHTPGPWMLDQYGHIYGNLESGESGELPLILDGRFSKATFADKRLIAAAPELLKALESIAHVARTYFPDHLRDYKEGAFQKALAAIAKARGE